MIEELWFVFLYDEEDCAGALDGHQRLVLDVWLAESESGARMMAEEMASDDQDNRYAIAKVTDSCKVALQFNWESSK